VFDSQQPRFEQRDGRQRRLIQRVVHGVGVAGVVPGRDSICLAFACWVTLMDASNLDQFIQPFGGSWVTDKRKAS
jgi:hypothetical protein